MRQSKIVFYAFAAAFGAVVVGMNMGGISGAIDIICQEFALTALAKGFVTGSILIGCLAGALAGGRLADRYGRKPMLLVSSLLLALSGLGCWLFVPSWVYLTVFRLLGGIGAGILSAVIPSYISEISPAAYRGTLVSFYQVGVVVGILAAYCWNFIIRDNWHLMLGLPFFFSVVAALLLIFLPESQVWIEEKDRLGKDGSNDAGISAMFRGRTGYVVFLGIMLAFFQQITGINVVVNYAPGILDSLGIGNDPLLQTVYIGIANLVFTLVALWVVDKFNRKTLLVTGGIGSFLCLAYLAWAYSIEDPAPASVLAAIMGFIGFFALSFSPLMFVVTAEMYPSRIRGTAMALSTGVSWACAFIVVQFYPWMEASLGTNVAFGIFAVLLLVASLFIALYIPETKGKTLEEIQKELKID